MTAPRRNPTTPRGGWAARIIIAEVAPASVEMKQFAFIIVSLVLGLLVCEAALRIAAGYSPFLRYQLSPPQTRNAVPDRVLKFRMSPYVPGHDHRGYRNETALDHADILALGDSWTYGLGAYADGTWPRQLQALSGRSVYNAGVGGYGPCEYLGVLDELAALRPAVVLVGLYLGNDIGDAYASVYLLRRCSNFATSDPAVLRAMEQADRSSTLRELAAQLGDVRPEAPGPADRIALYRLLRAMQYQLTTRSLLPNREGRPATFEAAAAQPFRVPMQSPREFRTVFRDPRLDVLAVDLDDPRMAEGLRITLAAVEQIRSKAASLGSSVLVVLLDSKPYLMSEPMGQQDTLGVRFARLIELEERVKTFVSAGLTERGIAFVDTAPDLKRELARGSMLFHDTDDTHPNAKGYEVIARAVARSVAVRR